MSNIPLEGEKDPADKIDESVARYRSSEKGKEVERKYKASLKGKEAAKRYQQGEGGFLAQKKYRLSSKGKEALERYQKSVDEFKLIQERKEQGLCVLCGAENPTENRGSYKICESHRK